LRREVIDSLVEFGNRCGVKLQSHPCRAKVDRILASTCSHATNSTSPRSTCPMRSSISRFHAS